MGLPPWFPKKENLKNIKRAINKTQPASVKVMIWNSGNKKKQI